MKTLNMGKVTTKRTKRDKRRWSPQQWAVFKELESGTDNVVVKAYAGTGKTTTVVEGLNYLNGRVALFAFNKSIADELKTRVPAGTGDVGTCHSFGFRFARQAGHVVLNQDRGFNIAAQAMNDVGLRGGRDIQMAVSRTMNMVKLTHPFATRLEEVMDVAASYDCLDTVPPFMSEEEVCKAALQGLKRSLEEDGQLDFSDMLWLPLKKELIRRSYDTVIVDEAQDMNRAQLEVALRMVETDGRIVVVGDPRQAIYGFMGADSGSIARLTKTLEARVLPLSITYRCPKTVVGVAQGFVPDFEAASSAPEGLIRQTNSEKMAGEAQPGDFILSRTNAPLLSACLELVRRGKRAKVQGRDIGKGLVGIIHRLRANDVEEMLDLLSEWEETAVRRAQGKEARIQQVMDQAAAIRVMAEESTSVPDVCARTESMFADTGASKDTVVCSTIHKAKGLEADKVFILCDSFRDPVWRGLDASEENNLKYVAVTRAKRELVWVNPRGPMPGMKEDDPTRGTETPDRDDPELEMGYYDGGEP